MIFINFLKKYYSHYQKEEIVFILNDLCIYSDIETSLNDFYFSVDSSNRIEIISQFVLTCREFVTTIYKPLHDIKPSEQKARTEQKIIEFANYLILDTCLLSGLKPLDYFYLLKQIVRKTCLKHSWGYLNLEKHLSPYNKKNFAIEKKEKNYVQTFKFSKPFKLSWQGYRHLDLFVDDLTKTFGNIKCKKLVYYLFGSTKTEFKIELPSKDLLPFLTLFYKLHESAVIKVIGNRGLFVYLQQHLQAPSKDYYPKRDFRKLRHEAWQNEKIKNDISRLINPLFEKYCLSENLDDRRTINFL